MINKRLSRVCNHTQIEWNINDLIDFGVWSTLLPILAYNVTRRGADLLTLRNFTRIDLARSGRPNTRWECSDVNVELQTLASERSLHVHALLLCSSIQFRGDVLLGLQREQRPNVLSRKNCSTTASSRDQPRNIRDAPCLLAFRLYAWFGARFTNHHLGLTQIMNDS